METTTTQTKGISKDATTTANGLKRICEEINSGKSSYFRRIHVFGIYHKRRVFMQIHFVCCGSCVCVSTGLFTYFLLFSLSLPLSTKFQCINISNQIINRKWMFYYMLIMSYCRCLKKRIQSIMNVPYNHHHFTVLPSRQSTFRTTTWAATNAHKKRGTHSIYSA